MFKFQVASLLPLAVYDSDDLVNNSSFIRMDANNLSDENFETWRSNNCDNSQSVYSRTEYTSEDSVISIWVHGSDGTTTKNCWSLEELKHAQLIQGGSQITKGILTLGTWTGKVYVSDGFITNSDILQRDELVHFLENAPDGRHVLHADLSGKLTVNVQSQYRNEFKTEDFLLRRGEPLAEQIKGEILSLNPKAKKLDDMALRDLSNELFIQTWLKNLYGAEYTIFEENNMRDLLKNGKDYAMPILEFRLKYITAFGKNTFYDVELKFSDSTVGRKIWDYSVKGKYFGFFQNHFNAFSVDELASILEVVQCNYEEATNIVKFYQTCLKSFQKQDITLALKRNNYNLNKAQFEFETTKYWLETELFNLDEIVAIMQRNDYDTNKAMVELTFRSHWMQKLGEDFEAVLAHYLQTNKPDFESFGDGWKFMEFYAPKSVYLMEEATLYSQPDGNKKGSLKQSVPKNKGKYVPVRCTLQKVPGKDYYIVPPNSELGFRAKGKFIKAQKVKQGIIDETDTKVKFSTPKEPKF